MQIEKIDISSIKEYKKNAKLHPQWQIDQIINSINQFGFNDPIAIDEDNIIIEGHGRYEACLQIGYEQLEVIRLEHLTEDQKKAYILAHNKLTMNTDFDIDLLNEELESIVGIDMEEFGFISFDEVIEEEDNPYTEKIETPIYEITGEVTDLEYLIDKEKYQELVEEIEETDIDETVKEFLKHSAARHLKFNYKEIAEYYAHANEDVQDLMERSALVIIDYDKAIEHGYIQIKKGIEAIVDEN